MAIIVNIDVMLARRKMSSGELAAKVGITPANLSILKTGKARARQGPRHPLHHPRGPLPRPRLPARRHPRIPPGQPLASNLQATPGITFSI